MIYFDNASTTELNRNLINKLPEYFAEYFNPSSIHSGGKREKLILKNTKEKIKSLLNTNHNVIFTSSATEANNLVLKGLALSKNSTKNEILVSKLEHKSVLEPLKDIEKYGFIIKYINVLPNGQIDIEDLYNNLSSKTFLVSIMSVNNETGIINKVTEIARKIKEKEIEFGKIYFHSDFSQSIGKINIDFSDIDYVTATLHKIHGAKGVGLIFYKSLNLVPIITGGNQELIKAGTENLPNILISCDALEKYLNNNLEIKNYILSLENYLLEQIDKKGYNIVLNGDRKIKLEGILNLSILGKSQDLTITYFDMNDIYLGTGAACNSDIIEKSETLKAMKLSDEVINSSIRISLSIYNTKEEIDKFIEVLDKFLKV